MTTVHDARWAEDALAGLDVVNEATLATYRFLWEEIRFDDPRQRALETLIGVIRHQLISARAVLGVIAERKEAPAPPRPLFGGFGFEVGPIPVDDDVPRD